MLIVILLLTQTLPALQWDTHVHEYLNSVVFDIVPAFSNKKCTYFQFCHYKNNFVKFDL